MRSTGSVEQPIELLSGLTNLSKYPINFSLVATLELTLHHPLPLRWRRLIHVSNQRMGVRPPLQRSVVLAIVTFVSKGRVPMRSTGSVEQPIELLSGLTNLSKYPINFSLVATLELTLHRHSGAVPPKQKLCPSKRGLRPEEINRLGATGLQIETLDSQIMLIALEFVNKNCYLAIFVDLHQITSRLF